MLRSLVIASLVAVSLCSAGRAHAENGIGDQHAAWRSCLHDSFALQAALSGRHIAADGALRDCRDAESAYLDALSTSPLLDVEDVSRVRPMLVARARTWLLTDERGQL